MKLVWPARWYDGLTPVARPVTLVISPQGVRAIADDGEAGAWSWHELRQNQPLHPGDPARLEPIGADGEALLIDDPEFLATAGELVAPQDRGFKTPARRRALRIALIAGATIAAGAALFGWGIPFMADRMARRVPVAWEAELGERVAASLTEGATRCTSPAARQAVDQIVSRLAAGHPSPYTFQVALIANPQINAFAAPGGYLVVNSGLLRASTSGEQLAAVLAHEMQHVYQQHGTRLLLRRIPLQLMLASISGNAGSASSVASALGTLGMLRYQREHEIDADQRGVDLMIAAGIDPRGMADFFRTLRDSTGDVSGAVRYISTHPATADRIAGLEARAAQAPRGTPLFSPAEWERIHTACH